jgi:hypothetical protein
VLNAKKTQVKTMDREKEVNNKRGERRGEKYKIQRGKERRAQNENKKEKKDNRKSRP